MEKRVNEWRQANADLKPAVAFVTDSQSVLQKIIVVM
jgi:hypothetical protein